MKDQCQVHSTRMTNSQVSSVGMAKHSRKLWLRVGICQIIMIMMFNLLITFKTHRVCIINQVSMNRVIMHQEKKIRLNLSNMLRMIMKLKMNLNLHSGKCHQFSKLPVSPVKMKMKVVLICLAGLVNQPHPVNILKVKSQKI